MPVNGLSNLQEMISSNHDAKFMLYEKMTVNLTERILEISLKNMHFKQYYHL